MKFHKNLTQEKWQKFSKEKQILNIASELSRTKFWLEKKNEEQILNCLNRTFELIDLTINAFKNQRALKELLLFREILSQFYINKDKNPEEFKKILKTLLMFSKLTSLVKI
jgi:hypothetical protein